MERRIFRFKEASGGRVTNKKQPRVKCNLCGKDEIEDHCETLTLEPSLVDGVRMIANKFPDVDLESFLKKNTGNIVTKCLKIVAGNGLSAESASGS
jgi:hypothetical protein